MVGPGASSPDASAHGVSGPRLAPIPRERDDDFSERAVEARRRLCEAAAGRPLPHLRGAPAPLADARGKVENLVGFAQVPIGIAGPLRVDASDGVHEIYVPMATTEGAMVASYSRGMRLCASGGGARSRVIRSALTQSPILVYADAERASQAARVAAEAFDELARIAAETTRHGRLVAVEPEVVGRRLVLGLAFETGDAIGINMAARAADLCSAWIERRTGAAARYVHGEDVEKRAHAPGARRGRGRYVVCDATVPRDALREIARTTPEALAAIARTYAVGFARLSTHNWLVQSANGLAAVMLACGQDVAYVVESATGQLDLDVDPAGDLYASATLPSLLVGTVGGGTGQGTAAECLEILGCRGADRADRFAEILAATVLAGDLSLMASFCTHEFVAAHQRLGRNPPAMEPGPG